MLPGVPGERERLVNKMSNLRQDRVPEPTLAPISGSSEGPAVNGRAPAARAFVLSLRLRTQDSNGASTAVSWPADLPPATLAMDVLAASGGVPDPPQGTVVQCRFASLQAALLAARRLQWAMEGLVESSRVVTAATVAIHSAEEPVAATVAKTLERLTPGQVLLSASMADAVQGLPSLAMRTASDGNWRELQWQSQTGPANMQADEQSVLGMIRSLGRQDPVPPEPERPPSTPAAPAPATTESLLASASLGRSLEEPESTPMPFWKKPWVIVIAAAAVLLVAAVMVIPALMSGGHPKPPVPDAGPKTTPAAGSDTTPAAGAANSPGSGSASPANGSARPTSNGTEAAASDKHKANNKDKAVKPKNSPTQASSGEPPPAKPTGPCDLNESEIPLSLQRADRLMHDGRLEDAQAAYERLVNCPSARDKAQDGLRMVKIRIATQNP